MPPIIDKPERARQFARAIASDLAMYNEAKLVQGIQNDNLFDAMKDEIITRTAYDLKTGRSVPFPVQQTGMLPST